MKPYLEQLKEDIELYLKVSEDCVRNKSETRASVNKQIDILWSFYHQVENYHE